MSELLDIIISAVDNASEVFQSVEDSVKEVDDAIKDSFDGSDFEGMNAALDEANAEVERLTDELAGIYMGDIEGDAEAVEQALAQAQDEAAKLKDEIENTKDQTSETEGEMEGLAGVLGGIAGMEVFSQLSEALLDMADKAGTVQDSWTRMGLAAEGAGVPIDTMKGAVSNLSEETGRAGGKIRESFIAMTSAGITDMNTMQTVFKGASAQAFILGTDVDSLANKFSGMAMKSTLSERTLKGTGITMQELGEAMGLQGATIDEIKDKWGELDVNQRAAALGMAASMNEGKDANDAYKNSWEGLQAQIDIAKGKLEVLVGKVLLPVLVPALKVAADVLGWLGDTIGAVMDGPLGGLISIIGTGAAVIALAVPAYMALSAAFTFLVGPALAAASALWAMVAPLLPFIAIGAAIALIIYEIGKAFGWWTDVGSMIDAIGAGLQRLWNAFINHPDVQAAIAAISNAVQILWGWIQQAGQAIMEFLGISTGGDFDIVRAIIDGVGWAWDGLKNIITTVIGVVQAVFDVFQAGWDTLAPIGEFLSGVFAEAWEFVMELLEQITPYVENLTQAWADFQSGQLDLPGLIMAVLTALFDIYVTIVSSIASLVLSFAGQLWNYAVQAGTNFLNGIVTYISQLPGRFLNYLTSVKLQIMAQMAAWVLLAKLKASELINGIISFLSQLPGKVLSTLLNVVSSIVSAGSQWVSAARNKASELVNGAVSTLSSLPGRIAGALSGVVDAIVKPFRDAYDQAKKYWDDITSLGGASGGEVIIAAGGEVIDVTNGQSFDIVTGTYTNEPSRMEIEVNEHIILDFANVPAHIDTDTLAKAIQDRDVLKALTTNRTFQDLDANIKSKIEARNNRSRGA